MFTFGSIRAMAWYTVDTTYVEDRDKLMQVRPHHRDYLRGLADQGIVIAGGPWGDDSGGFAVYQVDDRAQLDQLLAEDPYTTEGVSAGRVINEWKITLGAWLPKTQ
jgi:uncharacterized protein YciI